jgi:hypothetical protein
MKKLLNFGFVFAVSRDPLTTYFVANFQGMPSTFESEEGRSKRFQARSRDHANAVLDLLTTLEEQALKRGRKADVARSQVNIAESVLRTRSKNEALSNLEGHAALQGSSKTFNELKKIQERVERRKAKGAKLKVGQTTTAGQIALRGTSNPVLKAGCKLISAKTFPLNVFRRAAIGKHLEQLVEEDDVLQKSGVGSLSRNELIEACLDRGFGAVELSDAELRKQLTSWLCVVRSCESGAVEPHRLRFAAMATCATDSLRKRQKKTLPQLLYAP